MESQAKKIEYEKKNGSLGINHNGGWTATTQLNTQTFIISQNQIKEK